MARKVDITQLGDEIVAAMSAYTDEVSAEIPALVTATAEQAVAELRTDSPKKTGDYRKGWTIKRRQTQRSSGVVIHNKTDYQLTHLLEFGHVNRDGGRTAAQPHIAAVADKSGARLLEGTLRIIKTSGRSA